MNCAELAKNIREIEEARDKLQARRDYSSDTGLGRIKLKKELNACAELEDKILGTYLDDFNKILNSEDRWIKVDEYSSNDLVSSKIASLPDGSLVVFNEMDGKLVFLSNTGSEWKRDSSKDESKYGFVKNVVLLPNGNVVIKNWDGELIVLEKDNGEWGAKETIGKTPSGIGRTALLTNGYLVTEGGLNEKLENNLFFYNDKNGWEEVKGFNHILNITPIPGGKVVIRDYDYETSEYKQIIMGNKNGKWEREAEIPGYNAKPLPDGNVLIDTTDHKLVLAENNNQEWNNKELMDHVDAFYALPDGSVLASSDGQTDTILLEYKTGEWNKLKMDGLKELYNAISLSDSSIIAYFGYWEEDPVAVLLEKENGKWAQKQESIKFKHVNQIVTLPDGSLITYDAPRGKIAHYKDITSSLDFLKQSLGAIAAKEVEP